MSNDSTNLQKTLRWIDESPSILAFVVTLALYLLGMALIIGIILLSVLFVSNLVSCDDACRVENLHQAVEECAERGLYTLQECKVVVPELLGAGGAE